MSFNISSVAPGEIKPDDILKLYDGDIVNGSSVERGNAFEVSVNKKEAMRRVLSILSKYHA